MDIHSLLEGKWRIVRKLGEGGMGTVYLAHDEQLDREVAVKILAKQLTADQELVTRFEREAKMTAKLEHGNIVPVYAVGRFDDRPFIVMKKLEGQTLSQLLRDKGALSVDETLSMAQQVAAGLEFIHAKHFVHRDIKASNIYIGSDGHATILDFGILRSREAQESLTRTGMVMGTPQYMSPEQALGVRDIDHRSDLYALAVLTYECLTGTLPFDGDNELSIIQMQAHMPPPDLLQRAPWVPKPVADVVTRALSKRPDERYPSAKEFHQALATARDLASDMGPIQAPPPGVRSTPDRPRATTPAVPSGMGLKALQDNLRKSGPNVIVGRLTDDAPGPSTASLAKRLRSRWRPWVGLSALALVAAAGAGYYAFARTDPLPPPVAHEEEDAGPSTEALSIPLLAADGGAVAVITPEDAGTSKEEDEHDTEPTAHPSKKSTDRIKNRPEPHGNGTLNVVTTLRGEPYWASLLVDGERRGTTPTLVELPSGHHTLRVERIGFRPINKQVRVAPGKTQLVRLELQQ